MNQAEENLYNLIPREEEKLYKAERHKSKFHPTVVDEFHKNKHGHRTMGESKVTPPKPDDFLKKHSNEPSSMTKSSSAGDFKYMCETRKPPVPKPNEKPLMGVTTEKNFIHQNALENILSVSKKPEKAYVDRSHGDRFRLETSGLYPVYVKKKEYGQVPPYLDKRKKDLEQAQHEFESYMRQRQRQGEMYQLSEEERQTTIDGLKSNWDELHRAYQSLGVMVDTIPKLNRKEYLEHEMKMLERDIEILEQHKKIYISN